MSELERLAILSHNLADVRHRITAAEVAAERPLGSVTLIAITKTYPAADVRELAMLDVTDVGENRDQEASAKAATLAGLPLRWHFVGQVQRNKARSVARYAHVVQSVDRLELVGALGAGAQQAGRELGICCQVDLSADPNPGRGGASRAQIPELAEAVANQPGLRLLGLMAVAPLDADPVAAFEILSAVAERLRAEHPEATMLSAGMSGDLEAAVAAGATHVRVGSALLGRRTTLK
ncbi:MAG: YggS family pyridoxal phosphate-dependent enzyme [Candidatus Nanopelagicales bacterium]